MTRVHNFSAGPGVLPLEVLQEAAANLVEHPPFGMSIMEMSHRSKGWVARQEKITADLRRILGVPDDFEVLFLQGGASTQFAMVPMNLLTHGQGSADYIMTGTWATQALAEARRLGYQAREAGSSQATGYDRVPRGEALDIDPEATYVHYTSNNTIRGTTFERPPEAKGRPLVCDASSDILSKPFDFTDHEVVYAGAQKNMGPAGVTIVMVRASALERAPETLPTMMTWRTHAAKASSYNTPPVWSIYMVGLVLEWVERQGGLVAMEARNRAKAALLYEVLDEGDFYRGTVQPDSRSLMNIPFRLPDEALEARFLAEADAEGLKNLKGHRSVGGCRASLYNALPMESVEALVAFMRRFRQTH